MGIESYSFIMVSNQVDFTKDGSYWRLQGCSNIKTSEVYSVLNRICKKRKNSFVYKKIIDVFVIEDNGFFQGLEIKGCLSCFINGLEICFSLYKTIEDYFPVNIVISDHVEVITDKTSFIERIYTEYERKYISFQNQYGNKEIKTSVKNFYRYKKLRNLVFGKYNPSSHQ